MKVLARILMLLFLAPLGPLSSATQCTNEANGCAQPVPHLVKFSGALKNVAGLPHNSVVAIRFVIYGEATGGTPLWQEVQNTQLDQQGHYEVALGITGPEGVPPELFTAGEPRWLAVEPLPPGAEEQPRVLLVSVPYALKAGDANTLGGLPASAFAKAGTNSAALSLASAEPTVGPGSVVASTPNAGNLAGALAASTVTTPAGTIGTVPKFFSTTAIANSQITDSNGIVSMQNLSNILFADRFSGGVSAAIAACPANGCVIYALSRHVNLNLGNIDPGFKAITIYLGPYTYTVKQVTLRKGLKIIGMGASASANGTVTCSVAAPCNGTALQSINGNNPVFVIPQTNNDPATHVQLSGFRLLGSVGNTSEDGFLLDTSSTVNAGLWNSTFDDVAVLGFAGVGIHMKGRNDNFGALSQWLRFNNVVVIRSAAGGNALRMEGAVFELRFTNCEFDGQGIGDGTNIYIGGRPGGVSGYPMTVVFEGLVSQTAATAVQIDGGVNLTFYGSHHESLFGGYNITNNTNVGTKGLTIADSNFAGNVGSNGGAGYELNIGTTTATGIVFVHNRVLGSPDSVVKGTNIASVVYQDNLSCETCSGPPTSGITTQVSPAASINIRGVHSVGLNPSTTPITTIQSGLGPGEMVTFFTLAGPVTFGPGGNIDLMGMSSLIVNGTITFVRSDLGGSAWKPVSQWSPSSTGTIKSNNVVPVGADFKVGLARGVGRTAVAQR
jgi:hypothetical protein